MMKTFTFACVHFAVAFAVTYALTGSIVIGSLVALIEPLCNTVAYYVHERAWERWGNATSSHRGGKVAPPPAQSCA